MNAPLPPAAHPPAVYLETLHFYPPSVLPDADTNVILTVLEDGAQVTYQGYYDGEKWMDSTAFPILWPVLSWAHMPLGMDLRG